MPAPDRLEPYTTRVCLVLDPPTSAVGPWAAGLLEAIAHECVAAGASVIGHVKCHGRVVPHPVTGAVAEREAGAVLADREAEATVAGQRMGAAEAERGPEARAFFCNLTSTRSGASCGGEAAGLPASRVDLDLAVLVYGVSWGVVAGIVDTAFERAGARALFEEDRPGGR